MLAAMPRVSKIGLLTILLLSSLGLFWLLRQEASHPSIASVHTAVEVGVGALGLAPKLENPLNLLVMGEDISYSGPATPVNGWSGNTDAMMLVRFDPAHARVVILALPRDTYAAIPGHGTFKLNAANPLGGPELARITVAKLLDIPVDRYILANLFAVHDLVNALGGIRVYVPETMNYDDQAAGLHIHFQPGWHTMNGDQAAAYLRFRHDRMGDIGRVQRQQVFIQTLLTTLKQPANWPKIPQLLAILNNNIRTDLSQEEVDRIIGFMGTRPEVVRLLLPGSFWNSHGVSFWRVDQIKARALLLHYLHDADEEPSISVNTQSPSIAVRGSPAQVAVALQMLRKQGYQAFVDEYQVEPIAETCLIANGDRQGAEVLAHRLGLHCVEISGTGNLYADYTLLVGEQGLPNKPEGMISE